MLRGEFIRADGLVIPNNITKFGAATILAAAMADATTLFYAGLVDAVPNVNLQIESMSEPTLGVNGYARIAIPRNTTGWPVSGDVNNEPYVESQWLTWAATGGNFSTTVKRIALLAGAAGVATDITGPVFALSAPLPTPLLVTPTTPLGDRRYKYRVYLR